MKLAELTHYREMLRAQAEEPTRRGIFAPTFSMTPTAAVAEAAAARSKTTTTAAAPPPRRAGALFGRRPPAPQTPSAILMATLTETLVLDRPAGPAARLRLHTATRDHAGPAETPYHAEDLVDPPSPSGTAPGGIGGWSKMKPPSAQVRLLRRLEAVIDAERQGLAARLTAAGVEAV